MSRQPNSIDLCALSEVRSYVFRGGGNATATDDDLLQRLITAASGWLRTEAQIGIVAANYTETRSGHDGRILFVKNPPILSVTSVSINGNIISARASNDFLSNGYSFADSYVSLSGFVFSRGVDNVQIQYRGGYNSAPPEIEQACIEAVGWSYREIERLGQTSKVLSGETVAFSTDALSKRSQRAIERLRRVVPA
jgi:hypothetical protein